METNEIADAVGASLAARDKAGDQHLAAQRRLRIAYSGHGLDFADAPSCARAPVDSATDFEKHEIHVACEREIERVLKVGARLKGMPAI